MNAKVEKAGPPNGKVPKQNLKKRGADFQKSTNGGQTVGQIGTKCGIFFVDIGLHWNVHRLKNSHMIWEMS